LLGRRLSPRWRSGLWLLVIARLLLVVSVGSATSVFNLLPQRDLAMHAPLAGQPVPGNLALPPSAAVPAVAPESQLPATPSALRGAPAATAPLTRAAAPESVRSAPFVPATAPVTWSGILFFAWLAGAGGVTFYIFLGSVRTARRLRRLVPVTDPRLLALLADCETRLRMGRRLPVVHGPGIATPALHGFLRPRLLLPSSFAAQFSDQELRFILLHELAHVKRGDILVNWLAAFLQAVHWFNPFIWFGFARWPTANWPATRWPSKRPAPTPTAPTARPSCACWRPSPTAPPCREWSASSKTKNNWATASK
jgi:bla regulator protein BlaR1